MNKRVVGYILDFMGIFGMLILFFTSSINFEGSIGNFLYIVCVMVAFYGCGMLIGVKE